MSHFEAEEDEKRIQDNSIIIKPRGLHIIWGNDRRYWKIPERGSNEAVELKQVCWLEVTGTLDVEKGRYMIELEVSMKQDAFGWSGYPVFMMAKVGKKGKYTWRKINTLDKKKQDHPFMIPEQEQKLEIDVPDNDSEKKLYFGLYEVWTGKWKGGLQIHKAIITKI